MATYTQDTFFKHLRLYDYVLKNTKLSEIKRVNLQLCEPKCGLPLAQTLVLEEKASQLWFEDDCQKEEEISDKD